MNEIASTPPAIPGQTPRPKQRHGCLTAYLIFSMIANAATALILLTASTAIRQQAPNMPEWALPVLMVGGIFNLVCTIALFKWKKWGFWGFTCSAVVVFCVNLSIGTNPVNAVVGLLGIAILYGVLQIGGDQKGWTQLE